MPHKFTKSNPVKRQTVKRAVAGKKFLRSTGRMSAGSAQRVNKKVARK